jgi:hypothetical protein
VSHLTAAPRTPFLRLSVLSNWGYWDQLDGVTLEDGEALEVRWPDGTITRELVVIKSTVFQTYDHGHRCDCSRVEAFVEVLAVAGLKAPIRLLEHDIKAHRRRARGGPMNRHQRRRAKHLKGSPLVTATGQPFKPKGQRQFEALASIIKMTARELRRDGVDVAALMDAAPPRGFRRPRWRGGEWLVEIIKREAVADATT